MSECYEQGCPNHVDYGKSPEEETHGPFCSRERCIGKCAGVNLAAPQAIAEPRQARHKKTGNIYWVIAMNIIECTNGRENKLYVLYENDLGKLFCREQNEFFEKFEPIG